MSEQDTELEQMRVGVSCAVLLERASPPWKLDQKQSTRNCLKYRRAEHEVLLVTHGGRGWWDPHRPHQDRQGKGDVFGLVQYLNPGLNFGQVRQVLRPYIGISPSFPIAERRSSGPTPDVPFTAKWQRRRLPRRGSPVWRYLTETRRIPGPVVAAAIGAGVLREGPYASAWFGHTDHDGRLTGIEMRGPEYRGFSPGGSKTLFRLPGRLRSSSVATTRLIVAEAPIDAVSLAALERLRADTLYVSTAGGMGPGTINALDLLLRDLAAQPDAILLAATDNDRDGHQYAGRLAEMAAKAGVRSARMAPPGGLNDWNDVLKNGRGA